MAEDKTLNAVKEALEYERRRDALAEKHEVQLEKNRDLMEEMRKIAVKLNIQHDKSLDAFGKDIEKLTIRQKIGYDISSAQTKSYILQNNLSVLLEKQAKYDMGYQQAVDKSRSAANAWIKRNSAASAKNLELIERAYATTLKQQTALERQEQQLLFINSAMTALDKITGGVATRLIEAKTPMETILVFIENGIENFLQMDKAATEVRKSLGLMRSEASGLDALITGLTKETMAFGGSFEEVGKSITSLSNKFNSLVGRDRELVKTTALLSTQLGIANDITAGFLNTIGGITRSTTKSNINIVGFAKQMSAAAGVPLNKVMQDVANASDEARIFTGGTATSMVKAAVYAIQMGTTLDKMAHTTRQLLDFNTSIANEMEASVLLGKNVNFQLARELSYRRDAIGANQEILRITKQLDFSKLDPYQMEAFAKAAGKTVSELQDMVTADQNIQYIRSQGTVEQKAQLAQLEQMRKLRDDESRDFGKRAIADLQRQANQEKIVELQNKFNQLMMELSGPVMDVLNPLLSIATTVLPFVVKSMLPLIAVFKVLSGITGEIAYLTSGIAGLGSSFSFLSRSFSFFSRFSAFFGVFGKFLGPLGLIINAFTFIGSLMKRWEQTPKGILGGLQAIGGALYDTIIKPFVDAYDWISNIFVGHSPSKLALGILNGITSIGGMLLDALTAPFRSAFNFVSSVFSGPKIPKPSELISGVVNGTSDNQPTQQNKSNTDTNQLVVQKLDELIGLLKSGAIGVNIDGNRASYLLAKNTRERGGLGAVA